MHVKRPSHARQNIWMCRSDLIEEFKEESSSAEEPSTAGQSEASDAAGHGDRGEGFVEDYLEERRRSSTSDAVSTSSRDDVDVRCHLLVITGIRCRAFAISRRWGNLHTDCSDGEARWGAMS